jgi:hypothetical protein
MTSSASGAELALNYADGKLYYKNSSGVVTLLAGAGGSGPAGGSNTQVQYNNSGILAGAANMTYAASALSLAQNLLFTDNTYDIGASGATRPRSGYFGTNLTAGNNIQVGTASGSEYILKPGTDIATGKLQIQAGSGSSGYGGGLVLYSHSNATNPGWVVAGLSSGAAAKFAVNTQGLGGGTNVFTVDPTGLGYFASNVGIGTTPTTWTGAYALSVGTLSNFGQRTSGNADLVMSWDAKWSGGTSGAGYTYISTGDVASAYEQNGSHRFYTTPTAGTAGGAISFPVRLAISAAGYTYIGYQGSALANLNVLTGGQGGGVQLIRNTSGTSPTSGQSLGTLAWKGQDSANSNAAAEAMIEAVAAENFSGSTAATNMLFYTKNTGVGPGSAPSLNGVVNYLGQWIFGGATQLPDGNSKLTLYTSSSAGTGLTIYEQTTGNNARLRLSQTAGAVVYDATYSSGSNSHVFQIGSGTVATIDSNGLGVGIAPLSSTKLSVKTTTGTLGVFQQTSATGYGLTIIPGADTVYDALTINNAANSLNNIRMFGNGNAIFQGNVSVGTSATDGKLTVAYGNESTGQVQIAQFRTEATGSTTYNAGVQIYGTASATAVNRSIVLTLDPDGANAAGGDYIVLQKNGNNGAAYLYNASNAPFYFGTNSAQTIKLDGANTLQLQGFSASAYGTASTMQEWVGVVNNIANGATFNLFQIVNQYDNICYELNMFINAGGFFAYKSAGIFGYNGFTNTVLGSSSSQTITKTGTLYNEDMTIQNNQGATVNQYIICVRVFGLSNAQTISSGGQNVIASAYLTRRH